MKFTEGERIQYEKACERYFETQKRKSELHEKDKKLFEKIEKVKIGHYDVSGQTILMIAHVYQNNAIDAFSAIFRLGFLKGERKARKECMKTVEK